MVDDLPKLYETKGIPLEKKIIYQHWRIKEIAFYWLIAEMDRKSNLAFGYANLNNDVYAEWGYISMKEIIDNGAERDRNWRPVEFREALKKMEYNR